MEFKNLLLAQEDGVLVVTLNRPEITNALVLEMIEELATLIDLIRVDPSVRVLVLTGSGKAFSAGGNVKSMGDSPEDDRAHPLRRPLWNIPTLTPADRLGKDRLTGMRVMKALYALDKPIIAAVNGVAAGAGMDMALACDIRIASEHASFRQAYVRVGLIPFDGGMYWLPRLVGPGRAAEMMLTGDPVDAATAERIGLVNRVVPPEQLLPAAMELAKRLANGAPIAQQMIKHMTRQAQTLSFPAALDLFYQAVDVLFTTEDHAEAVQAFQDRRPPSFKGR
ncbi:MAG: enoyl-CoA hydratase [Gammaproteobacteria bacterium]|nr:MAG: enoyl-CoA hydratase [Gammaproteobacteria bacterium]